MLIGVSKGQCRVNDSGVVVLVESAFAESVAVIGVGGVDVSGAGISVWGDSCSVDAHTSQSSTMPVVLVATVELSLGDRQESDSRADTTITVACDTDQ